MKRMFVFLILFLSFGFSCAFAYIDGRVIEVEGKGQERSRWCWAATTQVALRYYNIYMEQCEIAEFLRVERGREGPNCCESPSHSNCNRGNSLALPVPGSSSDYFRNFGFVPYDQPRRDAAERGALSFDRLWKEIVEKKNVVPIGYYSSGWGSGHAVLVHGLTIEKNKQIVYIYDPARGHRIQDFDWLDRVNWRLSLLFKEIPDYSNYNKSKIIFDWLEGDFSTILYNQPQVTHHDTSTGQDLFFKHYPDADNFIATWDKHFWYVDQWDVYDLGRIDPWLPELIPNNTKRSLLN